MQSDVAYHVFYLLHLRKKRLERAKCIHLFFLRRRPSRSYSYNSIIFSSPIQFFYWLIFSFFSIRQLKSKDFLSIQSSKVPNLPSSSLSSSGLFDRIHSKNQRWTLCREK
ncbi:hypothetical protein YC2023_011726 [Brassica napus]